LIDPGTVISTVKGGIEVTKGGIEVVKVSWVSIRSLYKAIRSPRIALIGPTQSGKTTFIGVILNKGRLVSLINHTPTRDVQGTGLIKMNVKGTWGETELLLRNLDDTPGHRAVAANVVAYLLSYKPKVLIVVVDVSRPFTEAAKMADRDTSKWFEEIRNKGQRSPKQFQKFIDKLACVLVLMNQFDSVHDLLKQETARNPDALPDRLKEHERYYRDEITQKLRGWFELGARQIGDIPITYFKCCLVTYDGKQVTEYDNGHLNVFEAIDNALKTDQHKRKST
jgi:signal recognition particle receptor subunit beta